MFEKVKRKRTNILKITFKDAGKVKKTIDKLINI